MSSTLSDTKSAAAVSRLRCINCGAIAERAEQDFRCPKCGDLFEVFYPGWQTETRLEGWGLLGRRPEATLAGPEDVARRSRLQRRMEIS